jgi:hypothetical protein
MLQSGEACITYKPEGHNTGLRSATFLRRFQQLSAGGLKQTQQGKSSRFIMINIILPSIWARWPVIMITRQEVPIFRDILFL